MVILEISLAVILALLGLAILAILLARWSRRKQNEINISRYSSEQSAGLLDHEDFRESSSRKSKRGRGFRRPYSAESDASYDDQEESRGGYTPSVNSLALSRSSIGITDEKTEFHENDLLKGIYVAQGEPKCSKAASEPLSGTAGAITGAIGPIMQFSAPIPGATGPIRLSQKTIVQTPGPIVQYTGTSAETSEMTPPGSFGGYPPQAITGPPPHAITGPPSMSSGVPLQPIMISQKTTTRPAKSNMKAEPTHVAVPIAIAPVAAGIPQVPTMDSSRGITLTPVAETPASIPVTSTPAIETPESKVVTSKPAIETPESILQTPESSLVTSKPARITSGKHIAVKERPISLTTVSYGRYSSSRDTNALPTTQPPEFESVSSPGLGNLVKSKKVSVRPIVKAPSPRIAKKPVSSETSVQKAVPPTKAAGKMPRHASSIRFAEPIEITSQIPRRDERGKPKAVPHPSNLRRSSKSELKSGMRESRKATQKQEIALKVQPVPSQTSQITLAYQHKGQVAGPKEISVKRLKQKTGEKVEAVPGGMQKKEEKKEKEDTEKGTDKKKEMGKGQPKEGDREKDKSAQKEQKDNKDKQGDQDKRGHEEKDKKEDTDKENKGKIGKDDKKEYKVMKGGEDKKEDKDTKGGEQKKEIQDIKEGEDKKEIKDTKGGEQKEDKDTKGGEQKKEDKGIKGGEQKKEIQGIKGGEDKEEIQDIKGGEDKEEIQVIKGGELEEEDKDTKGGEQKQEDKDMKGGEDKEEDKNMEGGEPKKDDEAMKGGAHKEEEGAMKDGSKEKDKEKLGDENKEKKEDKDKKVEEDKDKKNMGKKESKERKKSTAKRNTLKRDARESKVSKKDKDQKENAEVKKSSKMSQ